MSNVLFVCNTYYQLIATIQMRLTIFTEDYVEVILSDHSLNAKQVAQNLRKTGIFDEVRFLQSKEFDWKPHRNFEGIKTVYNGVTGIYKPIEGAGGPFDVLLYFNQFVSVNLIFAYAYERNPQLKCHRFEEGILSYRFITQPLRGIKLSKRIQAIFAGRSIAGKPNIGELTKGFYCFYPELLEGCDIVCHAIPILRRQDKGFVEMINTAFSYRPNRDTYPQRYIFFASSLDIDGTPVGETELVLQIAELVGRENLLVKMHPRDGRDVYEKQGITVSRNSAVPWEVIQINHDFSSHVFLTVSSGSVVNASAMLGDRIPTFFLYPLVKGRNASVDSFCENVIQPTLDGLKRIGTLQSAKAVCNLQDIVL